MATSLEIIEYAGCLVSLGAVHEAINLLQTRNFEQYPEANFTLGMAYTALWDGKNSAKYFKEFISSSPISNYRKQIAKLNLLQSYLSYETLENSVELADSILTDNQKLNSSVITANTLIFKAQAIVDIYPRESVELLKKAKEYTKKMTGPDLWIDKWLAYTTFYMGNKKKGIRDMKECLKKSTFLKNTETIRDCFFYHSLFTSNEKGIQYVYKGTPISTFRKKIQNSYQLMFQKDFVLDHSPIGPRNGQLLDLNGHVNFKGLSNKNDSYKLLNILLSDFFRPFSIPYLFSLLKPDEYYLDSSPQVMRQQIYKLKQILKEHHFYIPIIKERYGHKIDFDKINNVRIKLVDSDHINEISQLDPLLVLLKNNFEKKSFRTIDIQDFTGLSMRTIQRSLKIGLDMKIIESRKIHRKTFYFFKVNS